MNFPVTKLVTDSSTPALTVPPGSFVAIRFGLAGLAFSPLLARSEDLGKTLRAGAEVGIYLALGYVSQAVGLVTEGAGEAGFLCSLQVVFVTLVGAVRKGGITFREGLSAMLAVAGVGVLEGIGGGMELGPGFWLLMLQPFMFGMSYLRIEKYMKSTDSLSFTASQLIFTALFAGIYSVVGEGGVEGLAGSFGGIVGDGWLSPQALAVAYTAVFGTIISIALETEALKHVSPRETSVVLTTEPLIAGLGGAWLLHEQFQGWLGAALILGASAVTFLPAFGGEGGEGGGGETGE
ncbi:hypothetical protein TrCOL_g804 [Triparma columacea]|uniref:EamA domain-containing protein n=1 Tax=Triparma columacea TaxID=722753 RepID=A0A9W7GAT0_9STRA|nr:hypothetical protein TrCOL_g804 [Triparma columacea]